MPHDARYSVVRYVGDIARNEPVNVAVVVWFDGKSRLSFDDRALSRAQRSNPRLERDALGYWRQYVETLFEDFPADSNAPNFISQNLTLPTATTAPSIARLDPMFREGLTVEEALDRLADELLTRLVSLPPKVRVPQGKRAHTLLQQQLQPLIQAQRVIENYQIAGAQTGRQRTIDFYHNSGVNTGLDIFPIGGGADKRTAELTADAYRSIAIDVLSQPSFAHYVLYVPIDQRKSLAQYLDLIRATFVTDGPSEIVTTLGESVREMGGGELLTA